MGQEEGMPWLLSALQLAAATPKAQLNATGGKIELRLGSPRGTLIGAMAKEKEKLQ